MAFYPYFIPNSYESIHYFMTSYAEMMSGVVVLPIC